MRLFIFLLFPSLALAAIPTKEQQFYSSLNFVIANATEADVKKGMVVASPSKTSPNYYFDWVRDTSLTVRALIDYYELKKNPKIKTMIFDWISAEKYRQNLPTLTGLGEPKFNVDGSGYTAPWGRPQNDGPALRSIAMIKFARMLFLEGEQDYVLKNLYHGILPADSVIKKDLEYVAHHWREHSFDIWEEEKGLHFYTLLAQHVALQEGAKLALELQDQGAADFYQRESVAIGNMLKMDFVDPKIGLIVTTTKSSRLGYKDSGLDVAPLLALIHTSPYQKLFSLSDAPVSLYIKTLTETFADLYQVNKALPELGTGIGRYPEDRYDGYETTKLGNPWFLSTIALAEYGCLVKNELISKKLLKQWDDQIEKQFNRVLFHSDRQGHLSEQFNHLTGYMQGAVDLTWSHNSLMTAVMRCGYLN